ncbi:MAG: 5-(carboxyamino)imidazole ribonucleotide mutase [Omnitrophica WOR_2 bacterium GWF2_43_52]|nr:MAG: 5-(carboxyamino)imidazole ribonucleotide mutase [Omnitrophica WOR_2 bacterium GWC2_44_8]OGX22726.1 MAG: 5-(carboxyamino)imidazole ribonucleotide mutase [Omnitrophica WOR_2 bacterium GWF2_43_52]HAH20245.1 5-(carboxyamino)imidazole ribonucleotide mutase [Candidatus Omnitrophota bacterium]HBG63351.1 5-(carboxyamino)imidazole ribonucleotide mutase [Candidatus Omnitrophota bacterium]HCD37999.1 5-(carboxyamino)imidazole ribonucleotide mutase [Candidatus Omnitrophota bacterium]
MAKVTIAIVMGSQSDLETMSEAVNVLKEFKADYEVRVLSAHRTPEEVAKFAKDARKNGVKAIIAGAGGAAALAGVIAAHTTLPIIGVPIETSSLKGLDSLLSTVQMPGGVPVAAMAIGKAGAKNAAIFALEILGTADSDIEKKLIKYKKDLADKVKEIKLNV